MDQKHATIDSAAAPGSAATVLREFLALLIERCGRVENAVAPRGATPFDRAPGNLLLAEAALRYAPSPEGEDLRRPLQVAVLGPTQSGKSTVVNLLLGRAAAAVSPLAGYTVQPQGFWLRSAGVDQSWLESLFPSLRRVEQEQLTRDRLDVFSVSMIEDREGELACLPPCVIWDTPDFDSLAAGAYRGPVLESAALADAYVVVLSKEKYSDLSVWQMLQLLEPLGRPMLICLNKISDDAAETITLDAKSVAWVVGQLEHYSLLRTDKDVVGDAFEVFAESKLVGEKGEFFTPREVVRTAVELVDPQPGQRILDPACGSGTFLVMAINRIKQYFLDNRETIGIEEAELFQKIIRNVIGFDLNPLAVLAARTNYLIAVRDLLHRAGKIEIPVYLCDSILTPSEYGGDLFTGPGGSARKLKTAAGTFLIPQEIAEDRLRLAAYAEELERAVRNRYTDDEFIARLKEEGLPVGSEKLHRDLFSQLAKLNEEKRNGVWARIIKNAFAPLFIERVDYVAGNPPWVNWEHLPEEYRQSTAPLWQTYDLFRHKGYKAKLGGGKDDVSILMLYVAHDCYLLEEGKLGFVITQTVFKTTGGGEGFRTFEYRTDDTTWRINPIVVHDLSSLQPFEGATNRTAVVIVKKQRDAFSYPVPYVVWDKLGRGRISTDSTLADVERVTKCTQLSAQPVDPEKSTSPWLTVPEAALPGVQKVIGCSDYRAYEGVNTGGLNGCYWIRILEELPNGDLLIENLHDVGKIKVERVQAAIEPDLVYPLLRGRDVKRWHAEPSAYIILANETDRLAGIPESTMKQRYPKTYEYFKRFEGDKEKPQRGTLRGRSGFKQYFKPTDPFYSMYNVGPYTMSKWKVVWREQTSFFQAATIGEEGRRTVCPDHKLMLVACSSKREACYLTGMLNSSPSILAVDSYVLSTSTSTHVLGSIAIRKFQAENEVHLEISRLARERATAPRDKDREAWEELEAQINTLAAKLWGINDAELKAIQDALAEKERPKRGRGTKA
ncbi:N-6 DNA methylase [bacterium]|nr:N-6 DNA methylase [bacterium]